MFFIIKNLLTLSIYQCYNQHNLIIKIWIEVHLSISNADKTVAKTARKRGRLPKLDKVAIILLAVRIISLLLSHFCGALFHYLLYVSF